MHADMLCTVSSDSAHVETQTDLSWRHRQSILWNATEGTHKGPSEMRPPNISFFRSKDNVPVSIYLAFSWI